ncbi:MAG: hypothetical protein J6A79_00055, partial [Clostridia bacterium]|nr:hypothetical protein [Clostridia bacterium]
EPFALLSIKVLSQQQSVIDETAVQDESSRPSYPAEKLSRITGILNTDSQAPKLSLNRYQ